MPRKARTISSSGIYHVILRSVNQQIIFEEDSDYLKFLYILSDCKKKYDFDLYAYCLMSNHIHLLLKDPSHRLSSFFQSLESRFARWYNQKYNRFGHLFQERFHSRPVEDNQYFFNALLYIHNNPVKENMCRFITEYRWSSANAYYSRQNNLINTEFACSLIGTKELLLNMFSREQADDDEAFSLPLSQPLYYVEEKALTIFKQLSGCASPSDVQNMPRADRNGLVRMLYENNLSYNQIARFCGISRATVYRIVNCYKSYRTAE